MNPQVVFVGKTSGRPPAMTRNFENKKSLSILDEPAGLYLSGKHRDGLL